MKSGELSSHDRISRRLYFLSNFDYWISESIYYRNNSTLLVEDDKIVLQKLFDTTSKTKVI